MDFETLPIGFVKTELSFHFLISLAESVFVSVSIKKALTQNFQEQLFCFFSSKNDSDKRNSTTPFFILLTRLLHLIILERMAVVYVP